MVINSRVHLNTKVIYIQEGSHEQERMRFSEQLRIVIDKQTCVLDKQLRFTVDDKQNVHLKVIIKNESMFLNTRVR